MMFFCRAINSIWFRVKRWCYLPFFKELGIKSYFISPIKLTSRFIVCKAYVYIGHHARIEGIRKYNARQFKPLIVLEDHVTIQQNLHLTCAEKITIGHNTAIAANVTITDINHPYVNITIPVEQQDIEVSPVCIGEDCKIYNNVVILPGVNIGKHVVIGANSVVNRDIPDYSVAVGIPAKVIKQYNFNTRSWERINE